MFDLIRAGVHTYYIENPARVGIYLTDDGVWLIDGGYSDTAGGLIYHILETQGWSLKGIIVTHSNPDHIGGCRFLQDKTGCAVYAHGIETAFTQFPLLHPSVMCGGFPEHDLRGRGMMAQSCTVQEIDGHLPQGLELIPLPGHFFDMIGIRTPDDVVFLGDSLCSKMILDRYGITFLYDGASYIQTLDRIAGMKAHLFVPAHVLPVQDIRELALYNKRSVLAVAQQITDWCAQPVTFEVILQQVFKKYRRTMNREQYGMVGSTVHSYLAWLKDTGRVTVEINDSMLYWRKL